METEPAKNQNLGLNSRGLGEVLVAWDFIGSGFLLGGVPFRLNA